MTDPQHEETFADTERKLREIITTLRAQLAEALEWKRYWSGEMDVVLAGRADETDRADRAEAALAAQIEVDAGIADALSVEWWENYKNIEHEHAYSQHREGMSDGACDVCAAIRNQPHDRTALDRYREKVLREAYDSLFKHPGFIHAISGQKFKAVKLEDAAEGILALIEKEKTK